MSHLALDLLAVLTACASVGVGATVSIQLRRRLSVGWTFTAGLVGFAFTAVAVLLVGGMFDRLELFGVVHVAYVTAVVGVPVFCLGWLAASVRRGQRGWPLVAAVVGLLPAPLGWYATNIEPKWLRTEEVSVDVAAIDSADQPIVIGVLSDLQTRNIGRHEREAVARIMAAGPDLVVLPGDLFQGTNEEFDRVAQDYKRLFAELDAPFGVFAVPGNADGTYFAGRSVEGTDVELLIDEVVTVDVRGRTILLGGVSFVEGGVGPSQQRVVEELRSRGDEESVRVLVGHTPDTTKLLDATARTDLLISGHTHGGQVAVPLLGWRWNNTDVPGDVAAGGFHHVDGQAIYVSTGVGVERAQAPVIRFGVRPSVGILTLH